MTSQQSSRGGATGDSPLSGALEIPTTRVSTRELEYITAEMVALPVRLLTPGREVPFDVCLPRLAGAEKRLSMIRVLPAGQRVTPQLAQGLADAGLDVFYCGRDHLSEAIGLLANELERCLADPTMPEDTLSKMLYDHAVLIIDQAMNAKRLEANLEHGFHFVEMVSGYVARSPQAQRSIIGKLVSDYDLYTHSVNVCILATSFAHALGMKDGEVCDLAVGALYHDIGKSQVPTSIIKKPGPLDDREWDLMRAHPRCGAELLGRCASFPQISLTSVGLHHENMDGTGYPYGKREGEIPPLAQIMRIIDAYDAITSDRAHQQRVSPLQALEIMKKEMQGQMAPEFFVHFVGFLGMLVV